MTDGDALVPADLNRVANEARRWLLEYAAPLWARVGRTTSGLFAERMTLDGRPDESYFRTFVQARHIFSFVEIGAMGWHGPWQELVGETVDLLLRNARRDDGLFVHRLDRAGAVLDGRADLYDQAFVLLALAKAGASLGRTACFDAADALYASIGDAWRHPDGGYREGEIVSSAIRRQNPHMHLFEAFLALHVASGRDHYREAALDMAKLGSERFSDARTGALLEYFTEDWRPQANDAGRIVEPGHCFEWAWLYEVLATGMSPEGTAMSDALVGFARRHGISADRGVAINEVSIDGQTLDATARLWPQTERLKAAIARHARLKSEDELREVIAAAQGLNQYLDVPEKGLWRDKLAGDGSWLNELAPGSSLYHISCAYSELAKAAHLL